MSPIEENPGRAWDRLRRLARQRLLRMHYESGVGHIGGNLSCLDLLLVLHHEVLGPDDQFVLSKGHSAGACTSRSGRWAGSAEDDLLQFHKDGTRLSGHPPTSGIDDILFATGSLGHGLSLAAGLALGKQLRGEAGRVFCLTSDGEWNEGSCWEALIFARHHRLDNLTLLVDLNGLQGFGSTREVADLDPLAEKFRAFGVPTQEIDGHDPAAILGALGRGAAGSEAVVARTHKGCGRLVHGRPDGVALPAHDRGPVPPGHRGGRLSMRKVFCQSLVDASHRPDFVFLTGDLGFMALEPLREALGGRFVNAGVAEQNMVTVAAGLARAGLRPWVYSIAPFLYARPFEQIRNDVCLHELPVVIVGNGGGYGYGVMGATHHALEDYGVVALPAPDACLRAGVRRRRAAQVKLLCEVVAPGLPAARPVRGARRASTVPPYRPWRRLLDGRGWVVLVDRHARRRDLGRRPPPRRGRGGRRSGSSGNSPSTRSPRRSWPTWAGRAGSSSSRSTWPRAAPPG